MLRVIARLEALAGELACANATDDEIAADPRACMTRCSAFTGASERAEYFHLNQDIHLAIVRIARNEQLRAMHGAAACPHEAHPLPRQRHSGQLGGGGRRSRRHHGGAGAARRQGARRSAAAPSRRVLGPACGEPADRSRHHASHWTAQ